MERGRVRGEREGRKSWSTVRRERGVGGGGRGKGPREGWREQSVNSVLTSC